MKRYVALVVEDNAATQELLKDYLELQGMVVWVANSCHQALSIQAHCQPDFILSDIQLVDGDGYSLLLQWRTYECIQNREPIPAIAFSALPPLKHEALAQSAGFQAYLQKPFDLKELLVEIEGVLSQRQGR